MDSPFFSMFLEPSTSQENRADHGAPPASHQTNDMRPDSCGGSDSLGTIQEFSQDFCEPSSAFTLHDHESQIDLDYQHTEKSKHRRAGAKAFFRYLEDQHTFLADVTKRDLQQWALTPATRGRSKGSLPSERAFMGARGLCVYAAECGYIDALRGQELAECPPQQIAVNSVPHKQQNPLVSPEHRESSIFQYYQSRETNTDFLFGARDFHAYLQSLKVPLAEVTVGDLQQWTLRPLRKGRGISNFPDMQAFDGAKGLCALAAELGYIDAQRANDIAAWKRPQLAVDVLRMALQNPALTRQERESQICLHYQNEENNSNRQGGVHGFLAYLEAAGRPLAEVNTNDLGTWALTPLGKGRAKNNVPDSQAFEGARALCVLAVEVGHIKGQRAAHFAEYARPHFDLELLRTALQNSALTSQEGDYHIRLNYQCLEKDLSRQAGANGLMAYLESQGKLLAEVSANDLEQWARTPYAKGQAKSRVPRVTLFQGAQALCALAAEVGHIDAQRAQDIALCRRPKGDIDSLRSMLQDPALTRQEREDCIRLHYQSADDNGNRQTGASSFQSYLEKQHKSLAEVSTSDLEEWALTPSISGKNISNLPNERAFAGAKALCAVAAEVGYINPQTAEALAQCPRPFIDVARLRAVLQNPLLTRNECDHYIRLTYQSLQKNYHYQTGVNGFLAYLETQGSSLAEVTKSDFEAWLLTPNTADRSLGNVPSLAAFLGAKGLCALAAEVGYINPQAATAIAQCVRQGFDLEFLRNVLQNPVLTRKECEYQIRLNYQSTEKNMHRQAGANGIMAYLESQAKSLADVTASDLKQWALTPTLTGQGKGTVPGPRAFDGAKGLCARAAEVGYIDPQTALELAQCTRLESGKRTRARSKAMHLEVNKRLRTDDQGASTSLPQSFAWPESPGFYRELALAHNQDLG